MKMELKDYHILKNMGISKKFGEFREIGIYENKSQIIMCHTSRGAKDYLASLNFRYYDNYDRIPHFLIKKNGEVLSFIEEYGFTNYHHTKSINEKSITIVLENLGWLDKKPLTNHYINWIGDIYSGTVYEKRWRDFFFWDPYPQEQLDSLGELCVDICDRVKIDKKFSGSNTKIDGISNFKGVVSRSNYDSRFTDLSPAFNFDKIINKIQYERLL